MKSLIGDGLSLNYYKVFRTFHHFALLLRLQLKEILHNFSANWHPMLIILVTSQEI